VAADEDGDGVCTGFTDLESDDWRVGWYDECKGSILDMVAIEPWCCLAESCGSERRAACVRRAAC
jgi:hypothetical protein